MTSEVILESIIYLVVIIVLHKIIKIYLLNVEHLFDNKSLDTFAEHFDSSNITTESWDELRPIQTQSNESLEYRDRYEGEQNNKYMTSENYSEDPYASQEYNPEQYESQEYNPEHYESQEYNPEKYESEEEHSEGQRMEHFTSQQIDSRGSIPEETIPQNVELTEDPSQKSELNQEPNANRFEILDDRFSMDTYNNCGVSNNNLNYASIQDSDLLSNNMSTLNEQFQIYSTKTENVEQPTQSFDSIMSKRNKEIQSYFESPNPQQMRIEIPNVKEANKDYIENINTNIIQNTNTNKYNSSLQYDSLEKEPQQNNNQQINSKNLESTSTNNSIELSDVRNKFALEKNSKLSENVKQISAYDVNSLAVI